MSFYNHYNPQFYLIPSLTAMLTLKRLFLFLLLSLYVYGFRLRTVFSHRSAKCSLLSLKMNVVSDAFRFFTNLDKEASAKHILMTGSNAVDRLSIIRKELENSTDLSVAFSEIASKVFLSPTSTKKAFLILFFSL